ncbi:hypothetical protein [Nocardia sp. XZ_19_369]|uniref:hypothetical protein n=1 Tax=Nocardia sp. XZ_19_369 TaxID=2769487 RepID=UPI0018901953|nr:hypothetical protein [Nocardia sp. XZ_19_369]
MLRSHRSAAVAISAMGAMAAALVLTSSAAPAATTAFTVTPGDPPTFVTDCAYPARVTTEPGAYIVFFDSQSGQFDPPNAIKADGTGDVIARWTPYYPGLHILHAVAIGADAVPIDGGERTIEIEVTDSGRGCAQTFPMMLDHE